MPHLETDRKYFFLPVNTGYVEDGLPTDRCVQFYADRSGHGLHCAIVGNVVIPNGHGTNNVCAHISDSMKWQQLANAISQQGACPGVQLSTTWSDYYGMKPFFKRKDENFLSASAYKNALMDISEQNISQLFEDLKQGINLAVGAGFKHIQIHAGHGYLFSLLIDNFFSKHSDFVLSELNNISHYIKSKNIESSLRFSLATGNSEIDKNRYQLIEKIMELSFLYFDISSGYYNFDKRLIYPSSEKFLRSRHQETLKIANQFSHKEIIISGKAHRISNSDLPKNVHIGICRDLIANPNFLYNFSSGCTNRMKCHYYSRGEAQLNCGEWK
jgi:2,4-dienoyl-CoA reductase-like NADH-dependent reductase (Old Yellow Enzyme family)